MCEPSSAFVRCRAGMVLDTAARVPRALSRSSGVNFFNFHSLFSTVNVTVNQWFQRIFTHSSDVGDASKGLQRPRSVRDFRICGSLYLISIRAVLFVHGRGVW